MRICHIADLHFQKDRYEEAKASIDTIIAEHERNPFDLIVIAGDTWHGPIQNTAGALFPAFVELIRRLADCAPVAMIYGTPSHDTEGSLEIFGQIETAFGIRILRPGEKYFVGKIEGPAWMKKYGVQSENDDSDEMDPELILFGVPEPNKKWLLANQGAIGKDEADAKAREAIRSLFLGLAGMRKEYSELPCVLLYHGQVAGAKSGTGFEVELGQGLSVSKDDLAMVGADYIALGDIHEPQQIKGIPAYYPGSIYPLSWGETHKAGANIITIGQRLVETISRLDFPHPQRETVKCRPCDHPIHPGMSGKLVWIELTVTKGESEKINIESWMSDLTATGALPGSRVTLNILPTETVRAGAITEKEALRDKVTVWADNSSITVEESVLAKADELELEGAARGVSSRDSMIRIDRLVLRGAIGIWKKSKKDEIDLDLSSYGSGVIALLGNNGAGKTTIIENLHPWAQMLTRSGTLKSHFRLKDSFRDLYVTDEATGWKYRAFISIRADIASGAAEYFLYRDRGDGFKPYPGINGRLEPYEAAVAEVFGSLEMFLRTAFVTQRPSKEAPDLSESTKGQRKALFSELAGIDYLDTYRAVAKVKADSLDRYVAELSWNVSQAGDIQTLIGQTGYEIYNHEAALVNFEETSKDLEAQGKKLSDELAALQKKQAEVVELNRQLARSESDIESLSSQIRAEEQKISIFSKALDGEASAKEEISTAESLEAEKKILLETKGKLEERNRKALQEWQGKARSASRLQDEARQQVDDARRRLSELERAAAVASATLHTEIQDHCPTCGQILPEERRRSLALEHEEARRKAQVAQAAVDEQKKTVDEKTRAMLAIELPEDFKPEPFEDLDRLEEINSDLGFINVSAARETLRKAQEASVRIEESNSRIKSLSEDQEKLQKAVESIHSSLDILPDYQSAIAATESLLATKRREFVTVREELSSAKALIETGKRKLAELQEKKEELKEIEKKLSDTSSELTDWRLLEKACGPDGIQALELDALAPSIAQVANSLLSEAYGSRYQIEFRTTREAGSGSKKKQVEDFEIFILDTENGDEQEIATLSGGEAVWIKKALYDAFGIIRARNAGIRYQTVILDEADGALDPESRMQYLRMLEAAHAESGRFQTLIITHSAELQAMVDQTIDVASLQPRATPGTTVELVA